MDLSISPSSGNVHAQIQLDLGSKGHTEACDDDGRLFAPQVFLGGELRHHALTLGVFNPAKGDISNSQGYMLLPNTTVKTN